jgi:hypothetical protein
VAAAAIAATKTVDADGHNQGICDSQTGNKYNKSREEAE